MQGQMLAPAAVLVMWSLIMLLWTAITRFGAFKQAGVTLSKAKPGGRGVDLEGVLPDHVQWKSHNYTHLMEQPTLFYAVSVIIALMGATATDALVAWAYVSLRIAHSIWQATINTLPVRFPLFVMATTALVWLSWRALELTLFANPGVVA